MGSFYRVTAIGFGARTSTRVVLQSLVRLPPAGGHGHGSAEGNDSDEEHDDGNDDAHGRGNGDRPPARPQERRLPAGRIGWREIANWDELHARARP
jgi:type IV pilus assembly protein PilX